MTGLVLAPRGTFEARVDLTGALPGDEGLAKLKIGYGGRRAELGELFEVSGTVDGRLTIEGGGAELDRVGAGLSAGEIVVKGDVGVGVGLRASGGTIVVKGSAGDFAASELSGGKVAIAGDVGARLGAAGDGSKRGMSGGVVVVGGSAGARAGERMRGGVILIDGDAAENAASDLIAGTLAIAGKLGRNAGRGMKRGTLFLRSAEGLASGFRDAGEHDLIMLRVLVRRSQELAAFLGEDAGKARRYAGDLNIGGKGEALIVIR
ncbi:formylmethanofuran dehydrogenase subunit C [Hansschlegelia zhihuaiae]|uniref:Formylmethanofuran dehydrogenase subunit C n=1 Tax=Hansschlegelia zhihuaiae TaxID=405005 RepID=A0A4Q0MLN5_9HYPH|nr:formylmethanofuran dehydrogenase subunit C [Hansschlegelia zhihuaiae]RXF74614.1 formylmethanofuran dehydrogenase subunit C [Hansschlegelia zhihuaiae]